MTVSVGHIIAKDAVFSFVGQKFTRKHELDVVIMLHYNTLVGGIITWYDDKDVRRLYVVLVVIFALSYICMHGRETHD